MVFVSKAVACNKKGEVKKGYRAVAGKNGRMVYLTETAPKKAEPKKKVAKPVEKKVVKKAKAKLVKQENTDDVSLLASDMENLTL